MESGWVKKADLKRGTCLPLDNRTRGTRAAGSFCWECATDHHPGSKMCTHAHAHMFNPYTHKQTHRCTETYTCIHNMHTEFLPSALGPQVAAYKHGQRWMQRLNLTSPVLVTPRPLHGPWLEWNCVIFKITWNKPIFKNIHIPLQSHLPTPAMACSFHWLFSDLHLACSVPSWFLDNTPSKINATDVCFDYFPFFMHCKLLKRYHSTALGTL